MSADIFLLGEDGRLESCKLMVSLLELKLEATLAPEFLPKDKSPILLDKLSLLAFVLMLLACCEFVALLSSGRILTCPRLDMVEFL